MYFRFLNNTVFIFLMFMSTTAFAKGIFRICAEPDNLPMSQESTHSGYEIEVAGLLAREMDKELEIKWVAQRDHSFFRETIGKNLCDAIMEVPLGFKRLSTTNPWHRSSFVIVTAENHKNIKSFDDEELKKLKIGVPATGLGDTPPVMALVKRSLEENIRPYSVYEPKKMMTALALKEIDVAFLWGPFGGWFAENAESPLFVRSMPDKDGDIPFAFDISIGVKKNNSELIQKLNLALSHQEAAIKNILLKWHMPEGEK